MKQRIVIVIVVQLIGLLCFNALQAKTSPIDTSSIQTNQQISEPELTKRFNAVLDKELSGENVCVTVSAAQRLNAMMTSAAQKVISEKAFDRVSEADKNVQKLAQTLLKNGTQVKNGTQAGRTRITVETIDSLFANEPPDSTGGNSVRDLFCPLFPIC